MNQSKAFLTSLIFAGLAMLLVYFYVNEKETSIKADFGTDVTVVVATQDINEYEQIQASMLQPITIPKKFVQPGANDKVETFEGAVAAASIRKGEQMLMTKVLLKGAETGLASQVAISRRAISIPVTDQTGITRLLKPGDRVDLVANVGYKVPGGQENEVKTLFQNVHILAVGEFIQNNIPSAFETDSISGNKKAVNLKGSRNFGTVTIEVTPQEAQSIVYILANSVELYMTLRNPVDRIVSALPTTTVDEVLGQNSRKAANARQRAIPEIRAPAAAPPPPNPWSQGGGTFAN